MPQIAIRSGPLPVKMEMGSRFRPDDDELFELCVRNPELRIERTAEGDLIVMTPAGGESSHRNLEIAVALGSWAREDGTGVAFDSSGGFLLPNGAMRSPDASWIRRSRLDVLEADQKRTFIPLCPDFVIELRSPSDSLGDLQRKMEEYAAAGASLGWLIDPDSPHRPRLPPESRSRGAPRRRPSQRRRRSSPASFSGSSPSGSRSDFVARRLDLVPVDGGGAPMAGRLGCKRGGGRGRSEGSSRRAPPWTERRARPASRPEPAGASSSPPYTGFGTSMNSTSRPNRSAIRSPTAWMPHFSVW